MLSYRLLYLLLFTVSVMFNAIALETVIMKYDDSGELIVERYPQCECDCSQGFDYPLD